MNTNTTPIDVATLDKELNDQILSGRALEAFEAFYADDVVMQDNEDEPWQGKAFNRERELEFFGSVADVHELSLTATAAGNDVTFSEWVYDLTFKNGFRAKWTQTSVRRWENGEIVSERFYHKTLG